MWNKDILDICIKGLFGLMLIYISVCDIKNHRIPDKGCVGIVLLALLQSLCGSELSWQARLLGALCISIPMLIVSSLTGGFGGGDMKLMAAGGWFLGCQKIISAFAAAILLAGLYCICILLLKKKTKKDTIPLGPFLSIGMVLFSIVCYTV